MAQTDPVLTSVLGGAELANQSVADNQADARAWAALKLRVANNVESFDHAIRMATAVAAQTGQTSNEQTVSPIRTGTGDLLAAASYPANRAVDTATAADAGQILNAIAALLGVQITAAGGASTPSQTQAKPTA